LGNFYLSYLDNEGKPMHVNIERTEKGYHPISTLFSDFTDFNHWLRHYRAVLKYNYDRAGVPNFKIHSALSTDVVVIAQGPLDPMKSDDLNNEKSPSVYGVSVSGYPDQPGGWQPICDNFVVEILQDWTIIALADGCNWGTKPRAAAVKASSCFTDFIKARQVDFNGTSEVGYLLLKAFSIAHIKIVEGKVGEDIWECGTTTLLGGVILPLDEGRKRDDPRFAFVCASVGDCKAFLYNPKSKKATEITLGNRGGLDATDPGGRLGPFVGNGEPDLRNLRLFFTFCEKGDLILAMSDGVHDNLDPISLGKLPSDFGLSSSSWKEIPDTEIEKLKNKYMTDKLVELISLEKDVTPKSVTLALIDHSMKTTQKSRDFMVNQPGKRLPSDYVEYPGKMDHTTCVCIRVGKQGKISDEE